ncbi:GNAT family N-acetyltransferase [Companilactobacillus zhongbaensis]|uniref:GNAT family N-acetyltransferase n=1 Tax=Companilactobacillus zhongbaensis TaxID=2486009 RepID=UPI000F7717C6|nr:GNAT family N-acetyltransferase [Companilactobacillus zhongbaensis]
MIKKITNFTDDNISALANIWLTENLSAHDFVDEKYWLDNLAYFKSEITKANVWTAQENNEIKGFIGLVDSYIAGIFVMENFQHQGIGRKLLEQAKSENDKLTLHVYQNNQVAIEFYLGQGFRKTARDIDEDTNQIELEMTWIKS